MSRDVLGTRVVIRFGAGCALDTGSGRVRAFQADRRCREEGCATVLSIYNPSAYCSVHDRPQHGRRGRQSSRQVLQRTCANDACASAFVTTNPARMYCSDRCRMSAFQQRRQAEKQERRGRHVDGNTAWQPQAAAS